MINNRLKQNFFTFYQMDRTERRELKISFCDSTHRGLADVQLNSNLTSAAVSPSFIFLRTDQLVNFLNIFHRTGCSKSAARQTLNCRTIPIDMLADLFNIL